MAKKQPQNYLFANWSQDRTYPWHVIPADAFLAPRPICNKFMKRGPDHVLSKMPVDTVEKFQRTDRLCPECVSALLYLLPFGSLDAQKACGPAEPDGPSTAPAAQILSWQEQYPTGIAARIARSGAIAR